MNENKPWLVLVADGWKHHYVPSELIEDISEDARRRFHEVQDVHNSDYAWMDLPGMIMVDRSIQDLDLDGGLRVSIPSEHFGYFAGAIMSAEPRIGHITGKTYYKVHGWLHCTVLTQAQRDQLGELILARFKKVVEIAKAEAEEFDRRLASIPNVASSKSPSSMKKAGIAKKLVSKPDDSNN